MIHHSIQLIFVENDALTLSKRLVWFMGTFTTMIVFKKCFSVLNIWGNFWNFLLRLMVMVLIVLYLFDQVVSNNPNQKVFKFFIEPRPHLTFIFIILFLLNNLFKIFCNFFFKFRFSPFDQLLILRILALKLLNGGIRNMDANFTIQNNKKLISKFTPTYDVFTWFESLNFEAVYQVYTALALEIGKLFLKVIYRFCISDQFLNIFFRSIFQRFL